MTPRSVTVILRAQFLDGCNVRNPQSSVGMIGQPWLHATLSGTAAAKGPAGSPSDGPPVPPPRAIRGRFRWLKRPTHKLPPTGERKDEAIADAEEEVIGCEGMPRQLHRTASELLSGTGDKLKQILGHLRQRPHAHDFMGIEGDEPPYQSPEVLLDGPQVIELLVILIRQVFLALGGLDRPSPLPLSSINVSERAASNLRSPWRSSPAPWARGGTSRALHTDARQICSACS